MPSLNIDFDFPDHPKTKLLTGLLGKGSETLLLRLWAYCGKFHPVDGVLAGYTEQEVEALVGWWGQKGLMVQVMTSDRCRWLHALPGAGYQVHEWVEHQGHLAVYKSRATAAARARWEKATHAPCNAPSSAPCNASSIPSSNAPTGQVPSEENTHTQPPPPPRPARQQPPPPAPARTHTPSWEEVLSAAKALDSRDWEWRARLWFLDKQARGWKVKGEPLVDWRADLETTHTYWEKVDGCPSGPPKSNSARRDTLDTHTRNQQLMVVGQEIGDIKAKSQRSGFRAYSPSERERLKALMKKQKELKALITGVPETPHAEGHNV